MSDRNASASVFGWNFQTNAAILLMLENMKDAKSVRVEGSYEDIEITLQNQTKLYAQVKAVEKPDDTSHVIDKLTNALRSLSDAAKNGDGSLFTYVTNSLNPFSDKRMCGYFTGRTHLSFNELPDAAKKRINGIIQNRGYTNLDVKKLDVRVIPFYGDDLKNRHKEILACINEFLSEVNVDVLGLNTRIMEIWQKLFFQNATLSDTAITISKEEMIWPLIVLVVDRTSANEYKKDFNDDETGEIEQKYKMIINHNTMSYTMLSRILSDYREANKSQRQFVTDNWKDYLDITSTIAADDDTKESLVKIVLYRVLTQRQCIRDLKRETNL